MTPLMQLVAFLQPIFILGNGATLISSRWVDSMSAFG